MSKTCTTTQQGYPDHTGTVDCQLSHTGFDLWLLMLGAFTILLIGAVLRWAGRK